MRQAALNSVAAANYQLTRRTSCTRPAKPAYQGARLNLAKPNLGSRSPLPPATTSALVTPHPIEHKQPRLCPP